MNDLPIIARRLIRLAALAALQDANLNIPIYSPGDWSTPAGRTPEIKVRTPSDRRDSVNKGMAEFTSVVMLEIQLRVSAETAEQVQDKLDELAYRIEETLFKDYWLNKCVQHFATVDTQEEFSSEGKTHMGALKISIGCELFEAFDPTLAEPPLTQWPPPNFIPAPLKQMSVVIDGPAGTDKPGINVTLPQ